MKQVGISRHSVTVTVTASLVLLAAGAAAGGDLNGSAGRPRAPWAQHIQRLGQALAHHNVPAALRAWQEAYVAARGRRSWHGLVEVGDASLRIGERAGFQRDYKAKARESYLAALLHARREGSLEGVLRVARAFAELGDREVVERCLRVADSLAGSDREAQADVRAFKDEWMASLQLAEKDGPKP